MWSLPGSWCKRSGVGVGRIVGILAFEIDDLTESVYCFRGWLCLIELWEFLWMNELEKCCFWFKCSKAFFFLNYGCVALVAWINKYQSVMICVSWILLFYNKSHHGLFDITMSIGLRGAVTPSLSRVYQQFFKPRWQPKVPLELVHCSNFDQFW
jgi:hypothetical protein